MDIRHTDAFIVIHCNDLIIRIGIEHIADLHMAA